MISNEDHINNEIEGLRKDLEKLQVTVEAVLDSSRTNQNGLNTLKEMVKEDHSMLLNHQKILITGNGEPSLVENFRTLTRDFTSFINEVKLERQKREKKEEDEAKEKKDEQKRWKWAFVSLGFTIVPAFFYQFFVFWTSVVPSLTKLP